MKERVRETLYETFGSGKKDISRPDCGQRVIASGGIRKKRAVEEPFWLTLRKQVMTYGFFVAQYRKLCCIDTVRSDAYIG